jgi:hypothetical protein
VDYMPSIYKEGKAVGFKLKRLKRKQIIEKENLLVLLKKEYIVSSRGGRRRKESLMQINEEESGVFLPQKHSHRAQKREYGEEEHKESRYLLFEGWCIIIIIMKSGSDVGTRRQTHKFNSILPYCLQLDVPYQS